LSGPGDVQRNEVVIEGRLLKRGVLRYTPVGTPAIDVLIGHKSTQIEAGCPREVRLEVHATAIGDMAVMLETAKRSQSLRISGFLAQRGVGDSRLNLHIVMVRVMEGNEHNFKQNLGE